MKTKSKKSKTTIKVAPKNARARGGGAEATDSVEAEPKKGTGSERGARAKTLARGGKAGSKKGSISIPVVDHTSVDEMKNLGSRAKASIAYMRGLFPKLLALTEDERRRSTGKLRDGEDGALKAVLNVVAKEPQYFEALADRDFGDDPTTFEHQLLLDRLARRDVLVEVAGEMQGLLDSVNDTVLRIGELVRPPVLEAYDIAKPIAQRDPGVRALLAPAIDFYGGMAKKALKTKKEKAKQRTVAPSSAS